MKSKKSAGIIKNKLFHFDKSYKTPFGERFLPTKIVDGETVPCGCFFNLIDCNKQILTRIDDSFFKLFDLIECNTKNIFKLSDESVCYSVYFNGSYNKNQSEEILVTNLKEAKKWISKVARRKLTNQIHIKLVINCREGVEPEVHFWGSIVNLYIESEIWTDEKLRQQFPVWQITCKLVGNDLDHPFNKEQLALITQLVIADLKADFHAQT